ncbi:response regulator [Sporocytophaga myxococcoides]|uniref:Response regulator n=1 Tax=Sporocytophaga myxococcoides TaxID=153721 RepID=A0A098LIY3_9BACT|nr:LytTR family DNA-binding domain-containing protein [Sporocytophaga myxococcoides]GAL86419.1 response regulator [Sporocytophaga myxococcoides]
MNKSAIIIDDELTSVEALRGLLNRYCPDINVVDFAHGVVSGLQAIEKNNPDLVFLDVEMKDGVGFDILQQLPVEPRFQVIFVTAFDHYAIKAFRFCALDYLLKPVDPDLLVQAVDKAVKVSNEAMANKIKILQKNKNGNEKIVLPSKDEFFVAEVNEIIRCEANGNYTIFYLKNHQPQLVSKTLKEFDELLSGSKFLRIHKSHLINLEFVERYLPKDSQVIMKDGARVEVSRRRKDVFLKYLFNN